MIFQFYIQYDGFRPILSLLIKALIIDFGMAFYPKLYTCVVYLRFVLTFVNIKINSISES